MSALEKQVSEQPKYRMPPWVLWIALASAAVVLLADGNPQLVKRGPPQLSRDARAASIVLVLLANWALLHFLSSMVGVTTCRMSGNRRIVAIAASAAVVGGALLFVGAAVFAAMHVVCHTAALCSLTELPERVMYTMSAGSRLPALGVAIALPLVIWSSLATKACPPQN